LVGAVVDPATPLAETTTATPDEIIARRRRRLLALASELGNVTEACRQMGVSRTRHYRVEAPR
jgi:molybdenum-dependent DNA-binding transcriptional regulator ModE